MAAIDDLQTARDQIAGKIKEITTNPKPSYSVDGASYSWGEYLRQLTDGLQAVEEAIQRTEGAWQVTSRMRS